MVFEISYDLKKPGQNYVDVHNAIKSLGEDWFHPMESTWFVDTALSVNEVRDRLLSKIDATDRLFIVRVNKGQYAGWMDQEFWAWLDARLTDSVSVRTW